MALYRYKAQTKAGKVVRGQMNVADEHELHIKLRENGQFLLQYNIVEKRRMRRALKPKVLSEFSRQLSTLLGAGITLVRALNIISSGEAVRPKEKAIYEDLQTKLRQGISLSDAMEQQNGSFPPLMISMFRSAEAGGNLDQVALKMADLYEKDYKLNSKIKSSMTYPKFMGVMLVGVVLLITNFILPQFEDMFSNPETLPTSTKLLMGLSAALTQHWFVFLVIALGVIVLVRYLMTLPKVRLQWHKFLLHMPMIGPLQKTICTSRFTRTMSSLYASGIPIVTCLTIARKTIGNDYIDFQFDEVIPYVRAGNNLSDALDKVDGFVRKMIDSVRVGEETGNLDTMLTSTSDGMEYDADMAVSKMVSYVEPAMMLIMGLMVGFVLVSVFAGMYSGYGNVAAF